MRFKIALRVLCPVHVDGTLYTVERFAHPDDAISFGMNEPDCVAFEVVFHDQSCVTHDSVGALIAVGDTCGNCLIQTYLKPGVKR